MSEDKVPGQLVNIFQIEIERQLQELIEIQLKIKTNQKIFSEAQKERDNQKNTITEAIQQMTKVNNMLKKSHTDDDELVWEVEENEEENPIVEVTDSQPIDEELLMNLLEEQQKLYMDNDEYDEWREYYL